MKKIATVVIFGVLTIPILASSKFITLGTGGVTGVYYPTGNVICRIVNKMREETKIRCNVESTAGSIFNVDNIKKGKLDFGIAQSDVVFQAYNGTGEFEKKPYKGLRTLITIYSELLTFVVRKDSNIKSLIDMNGKVINIGNTGSGQRNIVDLIFNLSPNLNINNLKSFSELKATQTPTALKDNEIDGYFYVVGHPTENVKESANLVNIDLVNVNEETLPSLPNILKQHPYYAKGIIPKNMYKGVKHDTESFGVKATLITDKEMSDEIVTVILKAILDNFEAFKKLHPAYKTITKESLLEGLGAPQHKAAIKYFKEIGLL